MSMRRGVVITRLFCRGRTNPRREYTCRKFRTAINLLVMMHCRDGELHAESYQREHDKPKAISRYFHSSPQLCPSLRVTPPMSRSWPRHSTT